MGVWQLRGFGKCSQKCSNEQYFLKFFLISWLREKYNERFEIMTMKMLYKVEYLEMLNFGFHIRLNFFEMKIFANTKKRIQDSDLAFQMAVEFVLIMSD